MTDDHWACFKAKNSNQVWGYAKKQIDLTTPTITITQANTTLTASSTDTDLPDTPDWKNSGPADNVNCDSNTTGFVAGRIVTNAITGKYYCFKVADKVGNVGYRSIEVLSQAPIVFPVDPTPPTLTLTQDDNTVTASGDNLSDFAYFASKADPTCDSTNQATYTSSQTAYNLEDDHWVCFKAKNNNQVYGWAKLQVDLTAPIVVISQDQDSVDASSLITSESWQNFKTNDKTKPYCDHGDTFGTASSNAKSISITSSDNNRWVCFRVKNNKGVYGYAKHQIDYNPPTITITRNDNNLTASSTDPDLPDKPVWKKAGPHNLSDCDSDTTLTNGQTIVNAIAGKYYCFSVADKYGNVGYKEIKLPGTPIVVNQTPTNIQPPPETKPTRPTINLTQNNDTVTASGNNLSDFAYFIKNSNPTCDSTNQTNYTSSQIATGLKDDQWVCFKAKDRNNVYGWAKLQVDLTVPTLTLKQTNDRITASGISLTNFSYFISKSSPDCSKTNTENYTVGQTTSSLADQDWACFKAKNRLGVYGYAKLQTDLTAPVITIFQNQTSVTASADNAVVNSWQNFKTETLVEPDCNSSSSFGSASAAGDAISITNQDNNNWVCFRVRNSKGVYGYAKYQIDYNPPDITVNQIGSTLIASVVALDLPDIPVWMKTGPTDKSDCDGQTTGFYLWYDHRKYCSR